VLIEQARDLAAKLGVVAANPLKVRTAVHRIQLGCGVKERLYSLPQFRGHGGVKANVFAITQADVRRKSAKLRNNSNMGMLKVFINVAM
jgi:hypothetical protein